MKTKKRKPPKIRAVFPPVTKNKWRLLTVEEAVLLKKAFGNELDITGIKIFVHSIWTTGNGLKRGSYSRVLGNSIHLYSNQLDLSKDEHRKHFLHEAAHVWQYQNFGIWYAPKSVILYSTIGGEKAEDYDDYIKKGIPFNRWNIEAQAQRIADLGGLPWLIARQISVP